MGALVGGGSNEQIEAVGRYFESVGLAFQIMDDVLNLRGLYSNKADKLKKGTILKRLGEDIVDAGKVTMPVAKAMARMEKAQPKEAVGDDQVEAKIKLSLMGSLPTWRPSAPSMRASSRAISLWRNRGRSSTRQCLTRLPR